MGTIRRALPATLMAVMALPVAAATAVTSGHSGWTWASPAPQGQALNDVVFSGGTGVAAGDLGTLLRTTDGGGTWSETSSTTFTDLLRVAPAGAGFVVSGGCVARRSDDAGATVSRVLLAGGETGCRQPVVASAWADGSSGYVLLQDGSVLSTADGGRTLSRRTALPNSPAAGGGARAFDLAFAGTALVATVGNQVMRSTDGANSWTNVGNGTFEDLFRDIEMVSPTVGYIAGYGTFRVGRLMRTDDGGQTWTTLGDPPAIPSTIRCVSVSLCLMTTGGSGLVRTADGGATYSTVNPTDRTLNAVAFASATRAVAVGEGGATVVSDDGGATWRSVGRRISGSPTGIGSGPAGIVLWGAAGDVQVSGDGGVTWTAASLPSGAAVHAARFADRQVAYALAGGEPAFGGTVSELWRSANGGVSWQLLDPGPDPERLRDLLPLGGDRLLLAGSGDIRLSEDGGTTFTSVGGTLARRAGPLQWLFRVRAGAVVAGSGRILWSANGRTGWKGVPRPTYRRRAVALADLSCTRAGACWALTPAGRVYVTTDLGRTWRDLTATIPDPRAGRFSAVAGQDGKRAYLVMRSPGIVLPGLATATVLRTEDGGNTWAPQVPGSSEIAGIVTGAPDALLGTDGAVFTTRTGGVAGTPSVLGLTASRRTFSGRATVVITGRLRLAAGGETVVVTGGPQRVRYATVASTGTFSLSYALRGTTTFVAHWAGDGVRAGDGSPAITVTRR